MAGLRFTRNAGSILLAIWLILQGLIALFGFTFAGMGVVMGVLALLAGVLILFSR